MNEVGFMRMKKLKGKRIVLDASRHNKREIWAECDGRGPIVPSRSHLNYPLYGGATPQEVSATATSLMARAGYEKLNKNAVVAIEVVFSLPPTSSINVRDYFTASLSWAACHFGGWDNVLSADVHLDERAPHCHVLLLPMLNGRMNGSDMVGYGHAFNRHSASFYDTVASKFGLALPPKPLTRPERRDATATVIRALRRLGDGALRSPVWPAVRAAIDDDPRPFLYELGIDFEPRRHAKLETRSNTIAPSAVKSAKKGKSDASEKAATPIGFGASRNEIAERSLCSVGIAAHGLSVALRVTTTHAT